MPEAKMKNDPPDSMSGSKHPDGNAKQISGVEISGVEYLGSEYLGSEYLGSE
jgi:hypothetical protein